MAPDDWLGSTIDGSAFPASVERAHVDQRLQRIREALEWWIAVHGGDTSSITGSGAIRELERATSQRIENRPSLALSSGTLALRVCLEAHGVGANDEVVCAGYDWAAATAAIRSLGATVVYANVTTTSLTIDAEDVAERITPLTKAVIATHIFGIPADIPSLRAVTDRLHIPVIEDCAQAFGATLDGRSVGALGAAAAFSFGPGKLVDADEGGLAVLRDADLYREAVRCSQHPVRQLIAGVETLRFDNLASRIHPVAAIVALHQLDQVDARLVRNAARACAVHEELRKVPVQLVGLDKRRRPTWTQVPVVLDNECEVLPSIVHSVASHAAVLANDDCLLSLHRRVRLVAVRTEATS